TTFSNNSAGGNVAGVLYTQAGVATTNWLIQDSTFNNNSSTSAGGVFACLGAGTYTFRNSTFTGNSAMGGGALQLLGGFTGTVQVQNCTIAGNTATSAGGGGIAVTSGTLTIDGSIIATNTSTAGDIAGTVTANFSLIGAKDGATITGSNNLAGTKAA